MVYKEKIKRFLGYKNIRKIKTVLALKKHIIAVFRGNKNKLTYNKTFFDNVTELNIKNKHVFFGYYDIYQLNKTGDKALIHILDRKAVAGKDRVQIAIYDLKTKKIENISTSLAWSWQQGSRLRWHPLLSNVVLFNDFDGSKYVTRFFDINKKEIVDTVSMAMYDIASDGEHALSLDFDDLQRLRPGYGYSCSLHNKSNKSNGIFLWSKKENEITKIIELDELIKKTEVQGAKHYLNHISISPSGEKFIFFHLWSFGLGTKWGMRLYICNIDGTDLKCVESKETISHYCWNSDNTLLLTALSNDNEKHDKYILYDLHSDKKTILESKFLKRDGHPTFVDDKNSFVTDTYPQKDCLQKVFYYNIKDDKYIELISVYSNPYLIDEYRCDLHPRVDIKNNCISIDTTYRGLRSVIFFHKDGDVQ